MGEDHRPHQPDPIGQATGDLERCRLQQRYQGECGSKDLASGAVAYVEPVDDHRLNDQPPAE